jgi:hypothetical protein
MCSRSILYRVRGAAPGPRLAAALVGAAACLATVTPVWAQDDVASAGSLRTPPSPAFAVLGIEPSAVERPATPADAAFSFINKLRRGTVPREFAFEASPYWLVSRPSVSWRDDAVRSVGESIPRTLSLSIATAETGVLESPITSLGLGVRTLVLSGHMTAATQRALEALEQTLSQSGEVFLRMVGEAGLDALDQMLANARITPQQYEAQKQQLTQVVLESEEYRAVMERVEDVAAKREGFLLELAAGVVWDFPDARWQSRDFRRHGVWVTPSYESGPWSLLGVLRYLDERETPSQDAVDWGGRALFSSADYALSLEYVQRSPFDQTDIVRRSHRFVGIAEYRVSRATWVIASFGKDRIKTGTRETLVAQIGLAFSFSKDRYFQ